MNPRAPVRLNAIYHPPTNNDEFLKFPPKSVMYERGELFRADEEFSLVRKGSYDLVIQMRICVPGCEIWCGRFPCDGLVLGRYSRMSTLL